MFYDASENLTEQLYQTWSNTSNSWVNDTKYTYEYNSYNHLVAVETFFNWNQSGSYYAERRREEYKCKLIEILSMNEMEAQKPLFQVYPNPVLLGAQIKINTLEQETLQIFDFKGKRIYETNLRVGLNTISTQDIPNITKGIYFLKTNSQSFKIIIN